MDDFWMWFCDNEQDLRLLQSPALTELMHDKLSKVDSRIAVEISNCGLENAREIIFSANGNEGLFPLIREIVKVSPSFERWRFIALKPARGFDFTFKYSEGEISPRGWMFCPLRSASGELGIKVNTGQLLQSVNRAILETVVETGIGEASFFKLSHIDFEHGDCVDSQVRWLPIANLAAFVDWTNRRAV